MLEVIFINYKPLLKILLYTIIFIVITISIFWKKIKAHVLENWNTYRKNPIIIPFAGLFKEEKGLSFVQIMTRNLIAIIKQLTSKVLKILMIPVYAVSKIFLEIIKTITRILQVFRKKPETDEDQKKFEQSFQFIKLANESKNKLVDKDIIKSEILRSRNVKKIFDNIQTKISNSKLLFQKKIIFIIGLPRSGTTLLHQILASANNTYGFGESIIFTKFFENNIFNKSFLSKILERKTFEDHIVNISNEIGGKYESITDKNIFIDKMPSNFYWVGFIKLLFPNSKIIHISRNIKDNCLSIYKNMFGARDMDWSYSESNIFKFVMNYRDMMSYWKDKYQNEIYEIKYEDLVLNKEEETKKLFNFCDMDWNEKIFDFYKNVKTIRTVSVNQVKKPIYTSSIDSSSNYTKFFQHLDRLED